MGSFQKKYGTFGKLFYINATLWTIWQNIDSLNAFIFYYFVGLVVKSAF